MINVPSQVFLAERTRNWRGRPLESHEVIVNLIASTTTTKGLRVRAALDTDEYPMHLIPDEFHGDWNYTIAGNTLGLWVVRRPSEDYGLNPVFRPEPAPRNAAAAPPAVEPGLTQKKIHDLAEEMEQLIADRDRFKNLPPVVRNKIDARLADIEAQLNA